MQSQCGKRHHIVVSGDDDDDDAAAGGDDDDDGDGGKEEEEEEEKEKEEDPALRRLFQAHHARVQHPFGGTAQSGCHFLGGHMSENVWGRPNEHI